MFPQHKKEIIQISVSLFQTKIDWLVLVLKGTITNFLWFLFKMRFKKNNLIYALKCSCLPLKKLKQLNTDRQSELSPE